MTLRCCVIAKSNGIFLCSPFLNNIDKEFDDVFSVHDLLALLLHDPMHPFFFVAIPLFVILEFGHDNGYVICTVPVVRHCQQPCDTLRQRQWKQTCRCKFAVVKFVRQTVGA